ncbi:Histidine kinase, variant 2 [Coniochaeta pulveracea]|nr:Histidine kinase, variant 2 [Coniochaeta pulveracea]
MVSSGFVDMLQVRVYPPNQDRTTGAYLNVTKPLSSGIQLPYNTSNGSSVFLGDPDEGYPPSLYPNLTYSAVDNSAEAYPGIAVTLENMLLLGPLIVNESYALMSITQPILSNSNSSQIIGYMTVVGAATELFRIEASPEGLGQTGQTLLIGPDTQYNRFNQTTPTANNTHTGNRDALQSSLAKFVLPVILSQDNPTRHRQPGPQADDDSTFVLKDFPAVLNSYSQQYRSVNNATALLRTTNEEGAKVATGAARPPTTLVDWVIVVEQRQSEALSAMALLRKILLICVFSTIGLVLVSVLPFAHLGVLPIRRLKAATKRFVIPAGYEEQALVRNETRRGRSVARSERTTRPGLTARIMEFRRRYTNRPLKGVKQQPEGMIKIPGKIEIKRHLVKDELTDLTHTFNDMSDELLRQYTQLEDKVAERTKQLELSKKAAETANQSKTVFIANVSHELKTPLNGILGMCAVCMEDDDIGRIKKSLKTVYESGTLLLRLLEDLLNVARYEVGQPAPLEEMSFSTGEVGKQAVAFFSKDARERGIDFKLTFIDAEAPSHDLGPGRFAVNQDSPPVVDRYHNGAHVGDLIVWGDQHRILQVVINLITNSFKFTPAGGRVDLRIRFLGETPASGRSETDDSETAVASSNGSHVPSQKGSWTARSSTPLGRDGDANASSSDWVSCLFEFEVEDTGQGIPEAAQANIFEPFVQGENGLARKYGGTGLGLAICRQLATLMGGTIWLKSRIGVGSTFTMRIPLRVKVDPSGPKITRRVSLEPLATPKLEKDEKDMTATEKRLGHAQSYNDQRGRAVSVSSTNLHTIPTQAMHSVTHARDGAEEDGHVGRRVLLADDNATNLEVLSRMLQLEKVVDVQLATNGREAFEKVKADMELGQHYDIIFMDIQMPEMDGLESTRRIRGIGYTGPIVALSAFGEEGIGEQCSEAGVSHYMSKPINRKALKQALRLIGDPQRQQS